MVLSISHGTYLYLAHLGTMRRSAYGKRIPLPAWSMDLERLPVILLTGAARIALSGRRLIWIIYRLLPGADQKQPLRLSFRYRYLRTVVFLQEYRWSPGNSVDPVA